MFKYKVQRDAGEWTAEYRRAKVMDMLVKMTAVLVKIAMMMMAPGSAPAPPEARGREPLSRPICDPIQKELEGPTKDRPAY